jgi:hypothetical protein
MARPISAAIFHAIRTAAPIWSLALASRNTAYSLPPDEAYPHPNASYDLPIHAASAALPQIRLNVRFWRNADVGDTVKLIEEWEVADA